MKVGGKQMGIHELWKLWALINHHTLCWIKVTPGLPSYVVHWAVPPVSQRRDGPDARLMLFTIQSLKKKTLNKMAVFFMHFLLSLSIFQMDW